MTFTHCPRCSSGWKNPHNHESNYRLCNNNCGMTYVRDETHPILCFTFPNSDDGLVYWTEDHIQLPPKRLCFYLVYHNPPKPARTTTNLPWLPFTITKEDLLRYLVLV
jgi:hypothetical protein